MLGDVNGINREYDTPSPYSPGTLRLVWNGQVYEPEDDKKGWIETGESSIQTFEAPRQGDVLQAFYLDTTEQPTYNAVNGSPFDPNNVYP